MLVITLKDGKKYLVSMENLLSFINTFPNMNFSAEWTPIWIPQVKKEFESPPALIPLSQS